MLCAHMYALRSEAAKTVYLEETDLRQKMTRDVTVYVKIVLGSIRFARETRWCSPARGPNGFRTPWGYKWARELLPGKSLDYCRDGFHFGLNYEVGGRHGHRFVADVSTESFEVR